MMEIVKNQIKHNTKRYDLIVFDLDLTLWKFHVDDCVFPFRMKNNTVTDYVGTECSLYAETIPVLEMLSKQCYTLAVASRIEDLLSAYHLLVLFKISKYFEYIEIFPGSKLMHFKKLLEYSEVPYEKMLFFDDDIRNIKCVSRLGVHCELIKNGISQDTVNSILN